ncbi:CobW family GTP-binding protein [Jiella pacifica]|uniref:CobW family GTP-binding protein n=1 Tax=Jiella pacifica TaxID=2696469 RepID=UPI0013D112F4|nr:GTP-binding protein [Jiella pacifica]
MSPDRDPLPATVLTGFLGAGKTTLVREILANPRGQRIGVLVNDFGEINIDAALIVEGSANSVTLSNGCVCCTIQSELVTAIRDLIASQPDLDRIVIEASGVSRSLPLADTMISEELQGLVRLDGIFCLVDAAAFPDLDYATTELAIDQITGADLLILNKVDLVTSEEEERLRTQLGGLTPHLRIVPSRHGDVPLDVLLGPARGERVAQESGGHHDHGSHDHGDHDHVHGPDCGCDAAHLAESHTKDFSSWSWRSDAPLDEKLLRPALKRVGAGLLRGKGVLRVRGESGAEEIFEFQQVGKRRQMTAIADVEAAESVFVAIGLSGQVDDAAFKAELDACRLN